MENFLTWEKLTLQRMREAFGFSDLTPLNITYARILMKTIPAEWLTIRTKSYLRGYFGFVKIKTCSCGLS
jgi:hypothetical protein